MTIAFFSASSVDFSTLEWSYDNSFVLHQAVNIFGYSSTFGVKLWPCLFAPSCERFLFFNIGVKLWPCFFCSKLIFLNVFQHWSKAMTIFLDPSSCNFFYYFQHWRVRLWPYCCASSCEVFLLFSTL